MAGVVAAAAMVSAGVLAARAGPVSMAGDAGVVVGSRGQGCALDQVQP